MPAHPAAAGRKAGPVCPRLPWGVKKCFPGGASENGPRFHCHQGNRKAVSGCIPEKRHCRGAVFLSCPVLLPGKMGRGSSGRRSGPPRRSASLQVRSGFLIFTKPAEKRRALSVICSPGCQLSGWQGWRLCPALRARTDTRILCKKLRGGMPAVPALGPFFFRLFPWLRSPCRSHKKARVRSSFRTRAGKRLLSEAIWRGLCR